MALPARCHGLELWVLTVPMDRWIDGWQALLQGLRHAVLLCCSIHWLLGLSHGSAGLRSGGRGRGLCSNHGGPRENGRLTLLAHRISHPPRGPQRPPTTQWLARWDAPAALLGCPWPGRHAQSGSPAHPRSPARLILGPSWGGLTQPTQCHPPPSVLPEQNTHTHAALSLRNPPGKFAACLFLSPTTVTR